MLVDWNPIAFMIGPLAVRWYGVALALAILLGILYFRREGARFGWDDDSMFSLGLTAVIGGIIGARLVFVVANFPHWFWTDPLQVFKIYEGGLSWHGALLGGVLVALVYLRRQRLIDFHRAADLAVPGLAIGYLMIRFANIANQEVLGRVTELSFDRWPAQLVGAGIALVLLARHFYLARDPKPAGYLFWSFILYHQLLRGIVEETVRDNAVIIPLYVNEAWGLASLTLTQLFTPAIVLFALWMLRGRWPKKKSEAGCLR
ncbi:MAG: prolipoprotein diacylglyceryl transferase [Desulforudis sp.]|nr:MAG: prolipoprotein diacylglyceryl transferase [Desulforudis sp.]